MASGQVSFTEISLNRLNRQDYLERNSDMQGVIRINYPQ